jgi:hypothetical protein
MHWKHSRFDIAYLILGNCHTVDEGYRVLCELEEDRTMAIESSRAESLRARAKVVGAKQTLDDDRRTQVDSLRSESYIAETKARVRVTKAALREAKREVAFIQALKSKLQPYRLFQDMEDHIAFQLIQPIEWRFDLFWQMYTQMSTQSGHINNELFAMLKAHPDSPVLFEGLEYLRSLYSKEFAHFLRSPKAQILAIVSRDNERPSLLDTSGFARLSDSFAVDSLTYTPFALEHVPSNLIGEVE